MKGGVLAMSQLERTRLAMMTRVREKATTIREASEVMGMSYRQSRRIYKRYRDEGDRGLIHRARGQPSTHSRLSPEKTPIPQPKKKYIPPSTHPWRKFNLQSSRKEEAALT